MTKIVELEDKELQDGEFFGSLEEEDTTQEEEEVSQSTEDATQAIADTPDGELPAKYRGKGAQEIIKMHQEAEKLIGRQGQEVSELRKLADSFIQQQINYGAPKQPEVKKQEEPDIDFFEDPKQAVRKALENSPEFQELKKQQATLKKQETTAKLTQAHPDWQQIGSSPEFAQWIQQSPVRLNLAAQADAQFDFNAANELLSSYKAMNGIKTEAAAQQKQTNQKTMQKAMVDSSGSGAGSSKKIYRRADIIKLMQTDRPRYNAMQDEILQAYAEGRVRTFK